VIAPDLLFFGLSQNVITATLSCCTVQERKFTEACILVALREYGLPVQSKLFADSGAVLLPMSISQVRSLLLVTPAVFRSVKAMQGIREQTAPSRTSVMDRSSLSSNHSHHERVLRLLESFQNIVAETNFYPVLNMDGKASVRELNIDSGSCRMNMLYGMT
jgi:hypothetical protein